MISNTFLKKVHGEVKRSTRNAMTRTKNVRKPQNFAVYAKLFHEILLPIKKLANERFSIGDVCIGFTPKRPCKSYELNRSYIGQARQWTEMHM
jgi:hypothetical protein